MARGILRKLDPGKSELGPGYLPLTRQWHDKNWSLAPARMDGLHRRTPYRYRWQAQDAAYWVKQTLETREKRKVNAVVLQFESPVFKRVYGVYYRKAIRE